MLSLTGRYRTVCLIKLLAMPAKKIDYISPQKNMANVLDDSEKLLFPQVFLRF